jgi:hypothetical protein
MLKSIHLGGVGPVPNLSAEFAPRLNVLTGDNGLGKSFLLDITFWALTGTWPGDRVVLPEPAVGRGQQWDLLHPVHPPFGRRNETPAIRYQVGTKVGRPQRPRTARFDYGSQTWARTPGKPAAAGLVIYAAANGSYCVWDPARNRPGDSFPTEVNGPKGRPVSSARASIEPSARAYQFGPDKIDQPLKDGDRTLCRGLVEDWTSWYYQKGRGLHPDPFSLLELVVRNLSHPQEPMKLGLPRRVLVDNVVDYPTIEWLQRSVAYPHWPAGVRRVLHLAYLLVWSWSEHVKAAVLRGETHADQLVLIIDEVEAHLHPKWQRTIVPALLQVNQQLHPTLEVQFLLATHSPLVMASLEPHFDEESDKLFWFDLENHKVFFRELPWANYGDAVRWLTSPIFDLRQARSREAEEAIDAAKAFIREDHSSLPPGLKTRAQIDRRLRELLGGQDPFLVRWTVSTEANGK